MPNPPARALLVDAGAPGTEPPPAALVRLAVSAEQAGATHLVLRENGGRDVFVLLGRLVAATQRIGLGAVVAPDRRPPALLAKVLSSLDVLSQGRALVFIAPGTKDDGADVGGPAAEIGEQLEVVRLLQRVPGPDYSGVHYRLRAAWNEPRRVTPAPVGLLLEGRAPEEVAALLGVAAPVADLVAAAGLPPALLAGALAAAADGRRASGPRLWALSAGPIPQPAPLPASGVLWATPPGALTPEELRAFAAS